MAGERPVREPRKHSYDGGQPVKEVGGVSGAGTISCSFGCNKTFRTIEAAAMHERTYHKKAMKRLRSETP